jgi:gas vesicle protein
MNRKFISGLLLGAGIGALLGLLFAPDKGSETRKKLAKKGEDLADDIKDLKEKIAEKYENIRRQAETVMHNGKQS